MKELCDRLWATARTGVGVLCMLGVLVISSSPHAQATADTRADEALLAARDAARRGDVETVMDAGRRMRALDAQHPLLAYPEYWALNVRLKRQSDLAENPAADSLLRNFIGRHEGTIVGDLARRDWLLVLGKRGAFDVFDAEYPRFLLDDDAQVSCYVLLSRQRALRTAAQAGPMLDAANLERARELLREPRNAGDGCESLGSVLAKAGLLDAEEVWSWVRHAFDEGQLSAARRHLALLAEAPPIATIESVHSAPARWLAQSATARTKWQPELTALALIRLARSDPDQAAEQLASRGTSLSTNLRAAVWAHIAASAARRHLPQTVEWSRRSLAARGLSEETLAWQTRGALRDKQWSLVRTLIEKMPASQRDAYDGTWTYWQARALVAEGRAAEATPLFRSIASRHHFYGQMATEDLGQPIVLPPPPTVAVQASELAAVQALPGLRRALHFYRLGMRAQANLEWNFSLRGMNDRQLLASAELARRNGVLDRAVNTADRTQVEHDFRVRFLTPFHDRLDARTKPLGLDLAWVYGLIRQESRFITDARSSAGASGLMQLMPATARYVGRKIGLSDRQAGQTEDTDINLTLGTNYLHMVLTQLDGLPVLATAAYNAGPGRPRTWRGTLQHSVEGAIFAETIPFNETRDYVKKVMSNAVYYAAMFESRPQSLKTRMGFVAPRSGGGAATSRLP